MPTVYVILIAVPIGWFALAFTFAKLLEPTDKKLNQVLEQLEGLRQYLYEIDPQFNDERKSNTDMNEDRQSSEGGAAAMFDSFLLRDKEAAGKRTLNTRF
jgi:hypothetical protein